MADPVAPDHAVGADASLWVEAMAADGSWILLCQAQDTDADHRRTSSYAGDGIVVGDRMFPTLVVGSGEGDIIEASLAVSADQRWLAVWRTGGLHLIDVRARTVTEVAEVLARDAEPPPIAAAFTHDGAWMAWSLGTHLTARELATGVEHAVELGDLGGRIWALEPAPVAGAWVRVEVLRRDTDGDGAVNARWGLRDSHPGPCARPWGDGFGRVGDEPDVVWLELTTGERRAEPPPGTPFAPPALGTTSGDIGPDRVAARDAAGRALLAREPATAQGPARGPLRWAD